MKQRVLSVIALLMCLSFHARAQDDIVPPGEHTNGYVYGVRGTRIFDGHYQYVYNDDIQTGQILEPCGRKFFFATYTGEPCQFEIQAPQANTYNGFTVTVRENGVITHTLTNVDQNQPFQLTFQTDGTKEIFFSNPDPGYQNMIPSINMRTVVEVIPKVEKVWVEVPEICVNNWQYGQDIPVEFKTWPAFPTLYHKAYAHQMWTGSNCIATDDLTFSLGHNNPVQVRDMFSGLFFCHNYPPQTPIDLSGYIAYADAAPYLANGEAIPLSFTFFDGVTTWTVNHKIRITGPVSNFPPYTNNWYDEYDRDVYASETWTATDNPTAGIYSVAKDKLYINHELRIHKGASLTINDMTVEFGPQGRVILEADAGSNDYGSQLVLKNTVLTAYRECGNENSMWEGVAVKGNASKGQQALPPNANGVTSYQGKLVMDHSEISYAHEAVRLWSTDPADWQMTSAGGIVTATDSRFYNNTRSAEFMKYANFIPALPNVLFNNASRFTNCSFEIDGNYVGTGPYKFYAFITGWAVRGLQVSGCSFANNGYTGGGTRGIFGNDLGLVVSNSGNSRSSFSNLTVAVENQYITGGPTIGMSVHDAVFTNNIRGIVSQGLAAPSLEDNTLVNAGVSASAGIVINTGSGYTVTGNALSKGAIGVLVSRTGSDPNQVKNNSFSNMGTGGLSNYKNTNSDPTDPKGLQFLCNTHDGVTYDIAALGANANTDGMAPEQGSAALPAGNTFYSGSTANINNPANQVGGITYYYQISGSNTKPNNNIGNVNPVGTNADNSCGVVPDDNSPYSDNPGGIYRKIAGLLNSTGGDSVSKDSLYYRVDQWNSPYGRLLKTDLLMAAGELTAAGNLYNTIDDEYEMDQVEEKEFKEYGRALLDIRINLVQNNKSLRQLSDVQVSALEDIAANAKMWAKIRAQNWLALYDGREFDLDILYPEGGSQARYAVTAEGEEGRNAVYPNPAGEYLQVYYTADGDNAIRLELYDMTGRKALSVSLRKGVNNLDVRKLQTGIYYYNVLEGEVVKLKGKLVKE